MNRRSFFTKLAVGIVAAPAIVKALADPNPLKPWHQTRRYMQADPADFRPVTQVRRTTYYPYGGDNDAARAYAAAMQRAAKQVSDDMVDHIIKCAIY